MVQVPNVFIRGLTPPLAVRPSPTGSASLNRVPSNVVVELPFAGRIVKVTLIRRGCRWATRRTTAVDESDRSRATVTSLFSEPAGHAVAAADLERYQSYKAVSALAVASLGLGILSVLAFFEWVFALVPLLAMMLGFLALRQIQSRSRELTGLPAATAGIILSTVMLPAGWGWLYYVYATEVPPDHVRITYDLFKPSIEELERNEFPPPAAKNLDGQRVFLKGYMFPGASSREMKEFTLCRDSGECCFGGQPKPWDMVRVVMKNPARAEYMTWQRKVAGVLRVRELKEVKHIQEGGVAHQLYFEVEADHLK